MLTVLYFGKLGDLMGTSCEEIVPPKDVGDTAALRSWLEAERGLTGILSDPAVRIAVNDEIILGDIPVNIMDRVAFLPPVGGG